jgi:serine/threonine protein kinase
MGVVYRAWDPALACVVAIKLVSEHTIPDESARRQLYTEARIASSLNHTNICISQLQQIGTGRYVPSLYVAMIYTGLGDQDQAFTWLDKAYAERCEYLVYLPTEPMADPLRTDPRFPELLKRLGLKK